MTFTIEVKGLKEIALSFRQARKIIFDAAEDQLDKLGKWTTGRAKARILNAGSVDLGELVQGVHHVMRRTRKSITVTVRPSDEADKYAIFVERGTAPHFPPISALQGWADRHGIPVWAVALKIAREGTEPRWMWRDTFDDVQGRIGQDVEAIGMRIIKRL